MSLSGTNRRLHLQRRQFLRLGHLQRGEQVGQDWFQRTAQPDIKEIGQIRVADVVVVGRINGDDLVLAEGLGLGVRLWD